LIPFAKAGGRIVRTIQLESIGSPIGDLLVAALDDAVCAIAFEGTEPDTEAYLARRYGECARNHGRVPSPVRNALKRYFEGDMAAFEGIASGARGTAFQARVWAALCTIPPGRTASYADMAERIGKPTATRAVGLANGQNPLPIMIPCHRVIGRDGSLTGFGGGLERKAWLLRHEGALDTLDLGDGRQGQSTFVMRTNGTGAPPRSSVNRSVAR
jgi:methylated-DNA-[protein]-cysteine S-methyltransferase